MDLVRAIRGPRNESLPISLIRGCFGIEAFTTGCAGLMALLYVPVFVVAALAGAGIQLLAFSLVALVLGAVILGFAAGLVWLGRRLGGRPDRWWWPALALQVILAGAGIVMYQAAVPYIGGPTEGPFVDGGNGMVGLLGVTYAGCGVLSVMLFALKTLSRLRPGAAR